MSFVLQAASIVLEDVILRPGYLMISGGVIVTARQGTYAGRARGHPSSDTPVVEVDGMVAAGFVDVHVHGGDGAQVNGGSPSETAASLERIALFHARHGTTSLLATTVSDTLDRLEATVAGVAGVVLDGSTGGSRILGVHLEGPWIARAKMGAQNPSVLRSPHLGELRSLVDAGRGCVRMVTLAPELPGADLLISDALGAGIQVAIGHTDADFDTARRAFDAGARHVTHLFNAMAPIHHRRPGAVTAALLDERVTLEVIADLDHVHPAALELAARLAPGRLVAVSDAVQAAGLEPGTYHLGQLEVVVSERRVTLSSDPATLAGSTLTLDRAVSNLVSAVGLPIEEAFAAASAVPARAAGLSGGEPEGRSGSGPGEDGRLGSAPALKRVPDLRGLPSAAGHPAARRTPAPVPAVGLRGLPALTEELELGLLGTLAPGAPADLVVLAAPPRNGLDVPDDTFGDGSLEVLATVVGGRAVWDPSGIFAGTDAGRHDGPGD